MPLQKTFKWLTGMSDVHHLQASNTTTSPPHDDHNTTITVRMSTTSLTLTLTLKNTITMNTTSLPPTARPVPPELVIGLPARVLLDTLRRSPKGQLNMATGVELTNDKRPRGQFADEIWQHLTQAQVSVSVRVSVVECVEEL